MLGAEFCKRRKAHHRKFRKKEEGDGNERKDDEKDGRNRAKVKVSEESAEKDRGNNPRKDRARESGDKGARNGRSERKFTSRPSGNG